MLNYSRHETKESMCMYRSWEGGDAPAMGPGYEFATAGRERASRARITNGMGKKNEK